MSSPDAKAAFERRKMIVRDALARDMRRVAQELVPGGKLMGQRYAAMPPHRESDNPTAFSVFVAGPKIGGWIDFVTGETGDALSLVMLVKGLSFKDAVLWAEDRYGLRNLSPEQRAEFEKNAVKRQAVVDQNDVALREKKIRNACHMFSKAVPEISGTLVDRYLMARGIDLRALPNRDTRWLRFLPNATYWMDPARPSMPAMIAGMVDGAGVMKACHLTFLRGDGRAKADVDKAKLMWPETKGLVIRLNNGKDNLDPEAAAKAGLRAPLGYGEGNEDGLSIAMGDPDLRVWAAASLSNLANVPDHACVSCFVVAQDNDWGKPQAAAGFKKGLDHLRGFNKPVVPVRSTVGKDFNDQLKGNG
jgi:hypothetical protein